MRRASSSARRFAASSSRKLGFEPLFVGLLLIAVTLGVAGAGLVYVTGPRAPAPAAAASVAPAAPIVQAPRPIEVSWIMPITLRDHRPIGGIKHLEVGQGDEVTVELRTNDAATVAIPGYEIWARVNPGDLAMLELTAFDWGNFRVEADGRLVGVLSVRPVWAGPAP